LWKNWEEENKMDDKIPEQPPETENVRIDPLTGLELPDPFSDYVTCPHCGEPEVEVWCYAEGGTCHNCGQWVHYPKPPFCGVAPYCKRSGQAAS